MRCHLTNDLRPVSQVETLDCRGYRRKVSKHCAIGNWRDDVPSTTVDPGSQETILCRSLLCSSESTGSTRDMSPLEAFFNSSSLRIHPTCSDTLPVFEYTEIFLMFVIEQFSDLEHRVLRVELSGLRKR